MIKNYCRLLLMLYEIRDLYQFLWIHDMSNIDLQIKLLKTHYEIKDTKTKLRQELRK